MALLKRSISHPATETFLRHSQTRFKSTSSSLVRTLTLVIHCNGGLVAVHSSLTSHVLQGIFFQFLVSSHTNFFSLFNYQLPMLVSFLVYSMQDLPLP